MACRRWQTPAMQTSGRYRRGQQQTSVHGAQTPKQPWPDDDGKCVANGHEGGIQVVPPHRPSARTRPTRNTGPCPARPSGWYIPASALRLSATGPHRAIISHRRNAGKLRGREPKLKLSRSLLTSLGHTTDQRHIGLPPVPPKSDRHTVTGMHVPAADLPFMG